METTLIRIRKDVRDVIKNNKPSISNFIESAAIKRLKREGLWK